MPASFPVGDTLGIVPLCMPVYHITVWVGSPGRARYGFVLSGTTRWFSVWDAIPEPCQLSAGHLLHNDQYPTQKGYEETASPHIPSAWGAPLNGGACFGCCLHTAKNVRSHVPQLCSGGVRESGSLTPPTKKRFFCSGLTASLPNQNAMRLDSLPHTVYHRAVLHTTRGRRLHGAPG
jgi:hypothetical protein